MPTSTRALLLSVAIVAGCGSGSDPSEGPAAREPNAEAPESPQARFEAPLAERDDDAYPHDPGRGSRSERWGRIDYARIVLHRVEGSIFDVEVVPEGDAPSLRLGRVDLAIYTPTAPPWVREDDYLTEVTLINQEWNRQQIRFEGARLSVGGDGANIERVDLARNCLNAGLWELVVFRREGGADRMAYHGWFDFPRPLYRELFEAANERPYARHASVLDAWRDPESRPIRFDLLRRILAEHPLATETHHDTLVPLRGDQAAKYANIISPSEPESVDAMLTDDARFASFDPPGPRRARRDQRAGPGVVFGDLGATLDNGAVARGGDR